MGDATKTYFLDVFGEALAILRKEEMTGFLIGSFAHSCHFRDDWDPASDIDLLLTKEDADQCLEVFPQHGFSTHVRDPNWIYKVAKPNVTIDLIFVAGDRIRIDEDLRNHSLHQFFEGLEVDVPSIEDMALVSVCTDKEDKRGHWYEAMRYLRRIEDWDYLFQRSRSVAPSKMLAALLYAEDIGIQIPKKMKDGLFEACRESHEQPRR